MARHLTHPALARRDAPCPKQGRSSVATFVSRFTTNVSRFLGAMRERSWRTFSASCQGLSGRAGSKFLWYRIEPWPQNRRTYAHHGRAFGDGDIHIF